MPPAPNPLIPPSPRRPSPVPRVSVGLPVYNGEAFLEQTLADWQAQTFQDFELVVVDNASTDRTPEILARAADSDARIRVARNRENIGALPNTNRAFALARAPLYALSAHDDRHAPDFLEHLVSALRDDPGAVLAYGDQTLVGPDGVPFAFDPDDRVYTDASGAVYDYDAALQRPMPDDPVARFRAVLQATDINAPIHGLFRREVAERVGPHQIWGSDRLIVAHAAMLGRFAFVDAPLFAYRIHPGSTVFLDRKAWRERDTGAVGSGSPLDAIQSMRRYLAAVGDAPLSAGQRAAAAAAVVGRGLGATVLDQLLLPGPDSYWGWTGRSRTERTHPGRVHGADMCRGWQWLTEQTKTASSS